MAAIAPKRILFLANPSASRGGAAAGAVERLRRAGLAVTEMASRGEEVPAAIARHAGDVDAVVVAGGDGSVNAAAAGLIESKLPLGIIPLGTANDLARTLGIPVDVKRACDVIIAGHRMAIDVGTANGRPFFNVASIGISARISRALPRRRKRTFGPLAYAMAALQVLRKARSFHVEIEADDGTVLHTRAMLVSVGNGRRYGGLLTVHATAAPNDGLLDIVVIELDKGWRFFPLLPSLVTGRYRNWQPVTAFKARSARVTTHHPEGVDLDGEMLAETPVDFAVLPLAVEVFTPA